MSTNLRDHETLAVEPEDPEELAFLEHLRVNGVKLATEPWDPTWEPVKQRPWWLAFILRTLRKLRLIDDH
jgi:hypothetical protein